MIITLCSELSLSLGWALPVLFSKGRKSILYPWPMEKAHTYISFQSSLFSQRVPLRHSLGHVVRKLKPSLYKIMHPTHLSGRMEPFLILGALSLSTDNRFITHFLICWLISVPLTGTRKQLSPMGLYM